MAIIRIAILGGLISVSCPQKVWADQLLTNADFLKWSENTQRWWLGAAVVMAGHVVHLHDRAKAKCVWDWYFDDPAKAQAQIYGTMNQYPDLVPSTVVIAWAQKKCGALVPK